MPAPAGRSVHSTGLPSAGQLAQRSRLPLIRRLNSTLTLGAGANNAVVACNQRTAIAVRFADGIEADAAGGAAPSLPAATLRFHYSPARLTAPLLRVGPRGAGEFKEIGWDEAMAIAVEWLGNIRKTDPRKLAFFTGRDQSQALTGWWAAQFGTPNYAAHGGFCSVNMAAARIYTIGGSLLGFGETQLGRTRYLLIFGVAREHDNKSI